MLVFTALRSLLRLRISNAEMPEHVIFGQEDILAVSASPIIFGLRISARALREMYGLQPFVCMFCELFPTAHTLNLLWFLGAFACVDMLFH